MKISYSLIFFSLLILQTGYLDIWEPATLVVKKEGYSIKCSGPNGVVITEKFSPSTTVCLFLDIIC